MSKSLAKRRREEWGQLGPCMRALPNDRWRDFVYHFVTNPGYGAQSRAARLAGFCENSKPSVIAKVAHRLAHDDRMIAAIAEESKKIVRAGSPEAVGALYAMIRNPEHKGHERAVMAVIDRVDPQTTFQNVNVTHRIVDPDVEALEEYRALKALGTTHEKLLELFGPNGLSRIEQQEAADNVRRPDQAKVIEADFEEVTTDG